MYFVSRKIFSTVNTVTLLLSDQYIFLLFNGLNTLTSIYMTRCENAPKGIPTTVIFVLLYSKILTHSTRVTSASEPRLANHYQISLS